MINPERQGHQYPPAAPYQVSREAIREFALAVQAEHPAHHDVEAAQELGHRDLVAPPSFAVVIAQRAEAAVVNDDEAGIDFSRVVHAEERFTHHSPILAGDTLSSQVTLDRIRTMGAGAMVTTVVQISAEDGSPRTTVTSSLLVRNEEDDA
ncbi:MaoC family dehydratase N-terminal domain-containing protein [Nesterenkonia sp. E16_7]|uniref:FAS1-like dehydratase domain-containing protein n=1 Tax=unclassified Nesterenkonia TaxID=2629769 RepID=UPI001A914068|nr:MULTISPECIES: MaoC family dehydratase N-terminal domain-containing protein [unclassified Nesterenkonia]MBO0594217.1 MaoC family dehydratase N-terminal domain-containing protein [Nesterenkonia sp. E16_10]MBO0597663.1 MaoC family dehydratase N-terminal domain-containing protein [Nesterenkonia sp. E16_7]